MAKNKTPPGPKENQPSIVVDLGPDFNETYQRYQHIVGARWPQWLAAKMDSPLRSIGKDTQFVSGSPLAGYMHAKLDDDISVVYRLQGINPRRLKIYGFYSHEDLGSMGKTRKKQAMRDRFSRQVFENLPKSF